MKLVSVKGAHPTRIPLKRERKIYDLLHRVPGLLEKGTQLRLLSLNTGPEKGPDFVAVNQRGHLVLGEIKKSSLRPNAWPQIKGYAKKYGKMRWKELDAKFNITTNQLLRRFLHRTAAWSALRSPVRRKIQLVLMAESFSDKALRAAAARNLGAGLKKKVKDVKCIEIQMYRVKGPADIVAVSVVSGRRRKLRR